MKILQVIPYFYPAFEFGGPVKIAYLISNELALRGHEVTVFTTDVKNRFERLETSRIAVLKKIQVHYMRNISLIPVRISNLYLAPELISNCKLNLSKFDIIHLHEYTTFQNIVVAHYARKLDVPYILQAHGSVAIKGRKKRKTIFNTLFGKRLLFGASKVIALTPDEVKQYETVNVPTKKSVIIPNGINDPLVKNNSLKGSYKKRIGVTESTKIILYLGRLHKTKGIPLLIKAYAHLVKDLKCSGIFLVIIGPDDGALAEIKSLICTLDLNDQVLIQGVISDEEKVGALLDAEVFVTPTFYGFPVTFLEACAVGTPIITTEKGDNLAWINGNVGFVVSPSPEAIAIAVYNIVTNAVLRDNLSKNAISYINENFSISHVVDMLEQTYQQVLEKKNKY